MTVVVEHKLFIIATYPTRNESLFLLNNVLFSEE
jgi:hypothetical protein